MAGFPKIVMGRRVGPANVLGGLDQWGSLGGRMHSGGLDQWGSSLVACRRGFSRRAPNVLKGQRERAEDVGDEVEDESVWGEGRLKHSSDALKQAAPLLSITPIRCDVERPTDVKHGEDDREQWPHVNMAPFVLEIDVVGLRLM